MKIKKIVLAFSGGLDTSVIISWLKENYESCEVIAFVADVGQDRESLENIEEKALKSGASECYVVDLREEFVQNYIYPFLKTGAIYEGNYLLGTAVARPVIAKAQIELAIKINADTLSHGATGKGNDQVRFETVYSSLAPHLNVIAPWRIWNLRSRESLLQYLKDRDIKTTVSIEKIYSRDENAWHISTEGGDLENLWNAPNDNCWVWTTDPCKAPDLPENILIKIEKGCIKSINGESLTPFQCLQKLNVLGAKHGIGRVDIVENRLVGMKSRGCYETPGGTIMNLALRSIEQLVLDRESFKWKQQIGLEMSYVIYDGRWFTPLRESLQSATESLAKEVNGEVIVKLYKGQAIAIRKKSINSLYSEEFSTFGEDEVYDQNHATGFIRLFSLSSRIRTIKKEKISSLKKK